jgi:TonB family protein
VEIALFDHVTKQEGARRAGRQGLFLLGSSALQVGLVVTIVLAASAIRARVGEERVVPVKFVRTAMSAPVAMPPAAQPPKPARRRPAEPAKAAPTALVQPHEIPKTEVDPDPEGPPEEAPPSANEHDGVVGGAVAAVPTPPAVATTPRPAPPVVKDEPAYAGAGFTRPRPAERNCVQARLRMPHGLEGFAATVTVKFAIGKDGTPGLFQVQGPEPDARLTSAIWQAVQECRWFAGTNPKGEPTKIWVVMPFRFQAG